MKGVDDSDAVKDNYAYFQEHLWDSYTIHYPASSWL